MYMTLRDIDLCTFWSCKVIGSVHDQQSLKVGIFSLNNVNDNNI